MDASVAANGAVRGGRDLARHAHYPWPRRALGAATIWALDDFTIQNGRRS
jgi:hypothetical protein